MAVQKLSQIAAAGAPPAVTDQAVFVTGGTVDNLITVTQLAAGLPAFTAALKGSVPASGGGTTNFLRADATFAAPPSTAPGGSNLQVQYNSLNSFAGMAGTSWNNATTTLTMTGGTLVLGAGSPGTPALAATTDVTTGIYFSGNNVRIATGGVNLLQLTAGINMRVTSNGGVSWNSATDFSGSQDTSIVRNAPGVLGCGIALGQPDTAGWIQWAGDQRASSDFNVANSVVLTNVTGMSIPLQANRFYTFDVYLTCTDAAAGGVQAAISYSAGLTSIIYDGWLFDTNTIKGQAHSVVAGGAVASSTTTATTGLVISIKGTVNPSAAGNLTVQFAQNTSNGTNSTVKAGSYWWVHDTP